MAWTLLRALCACVIISIAYHLTSAEIHRAKAASTKQVGKSQFTGENSEIEINSNSESYAENHDFESKNIDMDVENVVSRSEAWTYSMLSAVLVGLSGIFPLLVIPIEAGPKLKHGASGSRLKFLLSFAVGGLLGDVFLHLLPEAWQHVEHGDHDGHMKIGLWVLGGILVFLIIEKVFAEEGEFDPMEDDCEEEEEEETESAEDADIQKPMTVEKENGRQQNGHIETLKYRKTNGNNNHIIKDSHKNGYNQNVALQNGINHDKETVSQTIKRQKSQENKKKTKSGEQVKVSGYLNLLANCIDNFTHGLAVGGSYLVSTKVGMLTTFAILVHEIPHEIGDFAILLRSGFDRWKAAKCQLITASGGMIGALTALCAESAESAGNSTAWILPFTSGGFIYIALVTVVPDLLEEKHPRESAKQVLGICLGIASMAVVTLFCG